MTTLSDIRQKYPMYKDVPDQKLVDGFYNKFYKDKLPQQDFYKAVGYTPQSPAPSATSPAAAGVGSELLSRTKRVAGEQLSDITSQFTTPYERDDKSPGPEWLKRLGDVGGRAGTVLTDVVSLPFTVTVQPVGETLLSRAAPYIAKGAEALDPAHFKASRYDPAKVEGAIRDTGQLLAMASMAPGGTITSGKAAVTAASAVDEIASAAKRTPEGIKVGTKHAAIPGSGEEGFVTKSGKFLTREEALPLAEKNQQMQQPPVEPDKLHSEDIGRPAPPSALKKVVEAPRKILAPATVSKEAEKVAAIKREQLGLATRDAAASVANLERHIPLFDKLTPQEQIDFPRYMENYKNPSKQPELSPELKAAADDMRAAYKFRADKIAATKSLEGVNLHDDYLHRDFVFDNPDQQKAFGRVLAGKQGRGGFTKARKYPTYEEALAAATKVGGRPREANFAKGQALHLANSDMFIAHNRAIDAMKENGLWKYASPGKGPAGWEPLTGRAAFKVAVDKKTGRPVQLQAYAPTDAARVYNNFLSTGLTGEVGDVMRTAQKAFNAITALKLGLSSTWHAGITGTAAISSDLARVARAALRTAKNTTPTQALKAAVVKGAEFAKSESGISEPGKLFSPYRVAREGAKFHKQYLKMTDYGPDVEKLVDLATRANVLQAKRPSYMDMAGPKTFKEIFHTAKTPVGGAAGAFAHGFGKTMEKLSAPMFDKWIPNMKRGVTIERLQEWLKANPQATFEEQKAFARALGDSVDNRFGEMMRDNLFMNKALRDAMQFGLLSYSWVLGATRMAVGAGKELYQTARTGKDLGVNAEYLIANAVAAATLNSMYQYLHTGKGPDSTKDLFFPKTGGRQYVGKQQVPERAVLPTGHWTQMAHYMHDPLAELYAEGNIGAKVLYEALQNKDYRGDPIAKPTALWSPDYMKEVPDAVWRYFKYISNQAVTPISVQSYYNRNKGTGITPAETLMGGRPAPAFIASPEATEGFERKADQRLWKSKLKSDARLKARRENEGLLP